MKCRIGRAAATSLLGSYIWPLGCARRGIGPAQTHESPRDIALSQSEPLFSTSGLDLFLTRTAPAREFDRLNDDFNYVALVGAILFLIVTTFGSGWYSKRRDLLAAWR